MFTKNFCIKQFKLVVRRAVALCLAFLFVSYLEVDRCKSFIHEERLWYFQCRNLRGATKSWPYNRRNHVEPELIEDDSSISVHVGGQRIPLCALLAMSHFRGGNFKSGTQVMCSVQNLLFNCENYDNNKNHHPSSKKKIKQLLLYNNNIRQHCLLSVSFTFPFSKDHLTV